MLRRLFILSNALIFSWVQTAFAMKPDQMSAAYKFLQESGVTQHDVTIKEMYEKFGRTLPEPIRVQMEAFAKENPNYTIPKMDVKKVNLKGEEQLQLNVNTPKGSIVITTQSSKDVFATVLGSYEGKKIQTEIRYEYFLAGHHMMYEARKEMNNKKFHYLSGEEVSKLNAEEQKIYIKQLREILVAAEKVQEVFHSKQKASVTMYEKLFKDALIGEAWAGGSGNCVIAGWTEGIWNGSKCTPPAGARCGKGSYKCNPALYGEVECLGSDVSPSQFTETCNKRDLDFKHFSDSHSPDKFKTLDDLNKYLGDLRDTCDTSAKISDQEKACAQYEQRVKDLKQACKNEKLKGYYASSACKSGSEPQPLPKPEGPVGPTSSGDVCDLVVKHQKELDVNNCQYVKKTCSKDGKDQEFSYCVKCKEGNFNPALDGDFIIKCDGGKTPATVTTHDRGTGDKTEKEKSWWGGIGDWFGSNKGWLMPLGLVGVMMWLGYQSQKANIQAAYAPYFQPAPAAPVPVVAPLVTNPIVSPRPGAL